MLVLISVGAVLAALGILAWFVHRRGSLPTAGSVAVRPVARPNVGFWLTGSVVAVVGVVVVVAGALEVAETLRQVDPFTGRGPRATADAVSSVTWGAVVLTVGAYLWRGARRRGVRDRAGRLVIIVGYVLLGVAMSRSLHVAVRMWRAATEEAAREVTLDAMVVFLAWGVPAALLVLLGTRLAQEKVLMTVQGGIST